MLAVTAEKLATKPATATGTRSARGLAMRSGPEGRRCTMEEHQVPVYDDALGEKLRELRVRCGLGLREAAEVLGVRPPVLSRLETGEEVFVEDSAWDEAARRLLAARGGPQ